MKRRMAWVDRAEHLDLRTSELRDLLPGEVLIKTLFSAICGSDLHLYHDRHPFVKTPCTIGHELSGRVVAVGKAVTTVQVGDLVAPEPIITCGHCPHCLGGSYHMCETVSYGYRQGQAGFGDYYICDQRWAHKLSNGVSPRAAALVEPMAVAAHGVGKAGDLLGKSVVVMGAGAIGAFAAALCHAKGASTIILVDTNPFRLKLAAQDITTHILNPLTDDLVARVNDLTGGQGCDVVLECTGVAPCILQAPHLVRTLGTIVQVGISSRPLDGYDYATLLRKEITLRGSQGYCFDFETVIALIESGIVDPERYITAIYCFEEINHAFELAAAPNTPNMKILISY